MKLLKGDYHYYPWSYRHPLYYGYGLPTSRELGPFMPRAIPLRF